DTPREKKEGAAEKDTRTRVVEAASESGEGRDRERRQPADSELPEDEEEAGAEVEHAPAPEEPPRRADPGQQAQTLYSTTTSARRFFARPSAVSLSATGRDFP